MTNYGWNNRISWLMLVPVVVLSLALLFAAPASAQVAGATLSGLVTDENGGAVAGAGVSVKNLGTGDTR